MQNKNKDRNAIQVMTGLIGMVKPLIGYMCVAILMGCIGNLMAIFITVLGSVGLGSLLGFFPEVNLTMIFIILIGFAVLRGILRYTEQASNHFIAFKLLAEIRHQVFASLRRLAPAKLEGSGKGNLISIITSDIELLEVFYAHTISPIAIAIITSLFMTLFIGQYHPLLGLLAAVAYCLVGLVIPVFNSHAGQKQGREYRKVYGELNTTVLDNLYGLDEILQYQQEEKRLEHMNQYTENLERVNQTLKGKEGVQKIVTDAVILAAGIIMAVCAGWYALEGSLTAGQALVCVVAMMSSFGPVAALSALSNNLNQTLASGNRVLNLLQEVPVTHDIPECKETAESTENRFQSGIQADRISFAYEEEGKKQQVLEQFSAEFTHNQIHGILGKSGCGKSTLLKMLMRFYETDQGQVLYGGTNVNEIPTTKLRDHIAYVTQETFLFQDTIANNIRIAKADATIEEITEAAKKASVHEFISSLPNGYETKLSELGASVSGGEKQRIGLARAFLHDADIILLDEPTSNIDSLNEGIILKSLDQAKRNRTILLVSHRSSTMSITDHMIQM